MLPNLGQVSENQRQFSNRLLCSRRSFVRDNRNGLLNTGELWSVTSGRMEKLSLSLKRMGRRPALPVSHADWCEPWPRRARPGPLHEMPGRARLIDDLTLKSWVKIWLWVQIPALPHMVPKPQACDPNAQCLSFLLCQTDLLCRTFMRIASYRMQGGLHNAWHVAGIILLGTIW